MACVMDTGNLFQNTEQWLAITRETTRTADILQQGSRTEEQQSAIAESGPWASEYTAAKDRCR